MCTYCGCESITIIGRFMDEHVAIINANGELRRAVEAADRHGIERSADLLAGLRFPHTEAEEAGVFTVLARDEDFTEHIEHLCAEHDGLDAQLKRILAGQPVAAATGAERRPRRSRSKGRKANRQTTVGMKWMLSSANVLAWKTNQNATYAYSGRPRSTSISGARNSAISEIH